MKNIHYAFQKFELDKFNDSELGIVYNKLMNTRLQVKDMANLFEKRIETIENKIFDIYWESIKDKRIDENE